MMYLALRVQETDNVATVFANGVSEGTIVTVRDKRGDEKEIAARAPIPYGHKLACAPIRAGEHVIKYGESLGVASKDIAVGEHVHVQNLDSERGRGDKQRG